MSAHEYIKKSEAETPVQQTAARVGIVMYPFAWQKAVALQQTKASRRHSHKPACDNRSFQRLTAHFADKARNNVKRPTVENKSE